MKAKLKNLLMKIMILLVVITLVILWTRYGFKICGITENDRIETLNKMFPEIKVVCLRCNCQFTTRINSEGIIFDRKCPECNSVKIERW